MFSQEVKQQIYEMQNGYCSTSGCTNEIHSVHHKLQDSKFNLKKFPLFLNSVFNAIGLCYDCHKNKQHLYRITEKMAKVYESYLRELKGE